MPTRRLSLIFPQHLVEQPIIYQLIKKHDLMVNILRARVTPKDQGRMMVEISGKKTEVEAGLRFLTELGLEVQPLAQDVLWRKERCIECTACGSICPTGALSVSRPDMRVSFDHDKCIACELCVHCCPYKAIEIVF